MRVSITDGIERAVCGALAAVVLRPVSENSAASEKPAQPRRLAREPNGYDDRACSNLSSEIQFRKLGHFHFIPVVSKDYIQNHGLPTRANLEEHLFIQSEYYLAKTGTWDSWQQVATRGRIAHYCDNSFAYAMLVKSGQGIGLLGSYVLVEPCFVPLELGLTISIPLYMVALTERLNARPVRLVFDWLGDVFGNNPWFNDEFRLDNSPSEYDTGMRRMFNLEENGRTSSFR